MSPFLPYTRCAGGASTATQTDLPEPSATRTCGMPSPSGAVRAELVKDAVLVIIDDVSTTGATLDASAAVLLSAGAKEVRALTAARAVSRLL